MQNSNWVKAEKQECSPWYSGFLPAELIDQNASGSSSLGQLADLLNSSTATEYPATSKRVALVPIKLNHTKLGAGWESVAILLTEVTEKEIIRTTAEKIENIRNILGVSISHLAKILKTSRPSIYSWLDGEEPRGKTIQRIQQLCDVTEQWEKKNQYHFTPGTLLLQPIGKSLSMLERLERDELKLDEIESGFESLLELMHRRRKRMDRSKEKTKNSVICKDDKDKTRHEFTHTTGSAD